MEILIICLLIICAALSAAVLIRQRGGGADSGAMNTLLGGLERSNSSLRSELLTSVQSSVKTLGDVVSETQKNTAQMQNNRIDDMKNMLAEKQESAAKNLSENMERFENRLKTLEMSTEQKLDAMRKTISQSLADIRTDNNQKLDDIKTTVDEKLQKTLEEKMTNSFKIVSERLEQVYKGLGEMQSVAAGVGDLKKVLSNVKTRGILGEIQLGAILCEILNTDQYDTEVATVKGSSERVEFAVKLPAGGEGEFIYLPIDSKFPGDTYAALQDAYDSGDAESVKTAVKNLENVIKKCAKDIHDKYIAPPDTTNFAIMFLPFEGLYAEVVNRGMVEVLQRDYSVNIAGPSTMAAMLNSLQMGFKTLQIQKRSNEVWEILSAVKSEFDTFGKAFESAQKRVRQLDDELEKLVGTRTRAIQRKLKSVQTMGADESERLIGADEEEI